MLHSSPPPYKEAKEHPAAPRILRLRVPLSRSPFPQSICKLESRPLGRERVCLTVSPEEPEHPRGGAGQFSQCASPSQTHHTNQHGLQHVFLSPFSNKSRLPAFMLVSLINLVLSHAT